MEKISKKVGLRRLSIFSCTGLRKSKAGCLWPALLALLLICRPGCVAATELKLSMAEAIMLAVDYDAAVRSARHDSAAAVWRHAAARASRFPTISLDARTMFVDDVPRFDLPTGGFEIGATENYQADFRLSLPLFTGGRIAWGIAVARETGGAETARLSAEKMYLAYDCRKVYLKLLLAGYSVNVADASLNRVKIIEKDVVNLYQNGLADSIDILEARLAVERGRLNLDYQQTAYKTALAALYNITGIEIGHDVDLTEPTETPAKIRFDAESFPEVGRPELTRLDHLARAAQHSASLAAAQYFPRLNGFAGYSVGKPNRDMFNKDWDDYFSVGLTLNWQFNTGGKTLKTAAAARQQAEAARMDRKELENVLKLQSETTLLELEHAFEAIQVAEREHDLATRRFNLAMEKQKAGRLSVNRILEMEEELTASEKRYRAAVIQYFLAETELLYAVGSSKIFGGLQ
jgi:outer membrane protein